MNRRYFKKHLTDSQIQLLTDHVDASFSTDIEIGKKESHDCAIVFFDLCNFTNISWTLPPNQVMDIIQSLFKKVSYNVTGREGMIDKYPGDGVVAFFPRYHSKEGDYIVEYALDCVAEVMYWFYNHMRYWYDLPKSSHRLELSAGVDAGSISIAHVGSEYHSELILLGDKVNCANKCQSAAEEREVVIGQSAASRVRSINSKYFSTGPNIGVVYTSSNSRYLSSRFNWQSFAKESTWINSS